jgi:HemX protein
MLGSVTDRQWLWAAGCFYLAGFLLGTRSVRRGGRPSGARIYALLTAGYALQFLGLYRRGLADGGCPLGNLFEIVQFTAWSAITLYLVIGVTFRSSLLGYFTAALGAVLTLVSLAVPAWDSGSRSPLFGDNPWIEFHAALGLFSYGVFGLLALTSLLFLLRHHSLKSKRLGGWFSFLPSILDLDHIGLRLLAAGVALLAASLAIGAAAWRRDPTSASVGMLLATTAVWAAYAAALVLRLRGRLLAKRFAWTCVALFAAALISLGPVDANHPPAGARPPSAAP